MKHWLLVTLLAMPLASRAAPELTPLWQTPNLRTPESVLMIGAGKDAYLLVSEIEGAGNAKDGKGGIAKLSTTGAIIKQDWLRGLNAPKGMATFAGKLIVSDLDAVVIIDIASAKIEQRIEVPDAVFLNDIAVTEQGEIFVSDTRTNKVHRIVEGKPEVYIPEVKAPNGLTWADKTLYVAGADSLWQVHADKSLKLIAKGFAENADGLEKLSPGEFIVSCWAGIVYYVKDGALTTLLDTREQNKNTADIGINKTQGIIYIPTFNANAVEAYAYQ